MRGLKALTGMGVLGALVLGVPALLLAWGNPMALLKIMSPAALLRPDDGTIILGSFSVLGWVAWALVSLTAIIEAISRMSHQRLHIRLPGIRWLQPLVGGLVAMALNPLLPAGADEPPPPIAAQAPLTTGHPTTPAPRVQQEPPSNVRGYVVQPGDELWGVAERELGSGLEWRMITQSNPGMTVDTALVPGTTIRLPVLPPAVAASPPESPQHFRVKRGDTLWDLASVHLGDPQRWPELFDANRDIIADPDQIDVGWLLLVPQPKETQEPSDRSPSTEGAETPVSATPLTVEPVPVITPSHPVSEANSPREESTLLPGVPEITRPTEPSASSQVPSPPLESPPSVASPPSVQSPPSVLNEQPALDLLGPVGGLLAAGLVAGVVARRHLQLLQRGLGRRISSLAPSLQRFFSALVQRSQSVSVAHVPLSATSVIVGWNDSRDVHIDLESERCILIAGSAENIAGMAATMCTSLLCAEWSSSVHVVAVAPLEDWSSALDDPRLTTEAHTDEALARLQLLCSQRRLELGHTDLSTVRADDDRADAFAPVVFVFCQMLRPGHLDRIRDCLSLGRVGVSAVAAAHGAASTENLFSTLTIESDTSARLGTQGAVFQPQLLNQPARHAVMSLFSSAQDERTEPAPWWRDGAPPVVNDLPNQAEETAEDDAMTVWLPNPGHPTLLVLGPVDLTGTQGERPVRAVHQCMEYCAWLLLNPGSTPTAMKQDLLVAEGTRRSNMSRLRTWLGDDVAHKAYLPDAYSGHISLAPQVTSDWERFQSLLAGGVNCSSTPLLHQALSLVRGRPLEGVAFQWPWAAQWLTDMLSMISDTAVSLADRCATQKDFAGALWALDQAELALGEDETVTVRRILVHALMGDHEQVGTAVTRLMRNARAENRDLSPESIQRVQHALHMHLHATGHIRTSALQGS
ncbi:LysM peptidoglycan-binding domain-containing protein [Tessaracoccus sp.]